MELRAVLTFHQDYTWAKKGDEFIFDMGGVAAPRSGAIGAWLGASERAFLSLPCHKPGDAAHFYQCGTPFSSLRIESVPDAPKPLTDKELGEWIAAYIPGFSVRRFLEELLSRRASESELLKAAEAAVNYELLSRTATWQPMGKESTFDRLRAAVQKAKESASGRK